MSSRFLLALVCLITSYLLLATPKAHAQWGVGMYGAMQQCPYGVSGGAGASDYDDEIDDIRKKIREVDSDLRTARADLRDAEKSVNDRRRQITRNMNYRVGSLVEEHISKGYSCLRYRGIGDVICRGRTAFLNDIDYNESRSRMPAQASGSPVGSPPASASPVAAPPAPAAPQPAAPGVAAQPAPTQQVVQQQAPQAGAPGQGGGVVAGSEAELLAQRRAAMAGAANPGGSPGVSGGVRCEDAGRTEVPSEIAGNWVHYCEPGGQVRDAGTLCSTYPGSSSSSKEDCEEGIKELPDSIAKRAEAKSKADGLEAEKRRLSSRLSALQRSRREEQRERLREMTEGGVCYDCLANNNRERRTDWGGVAANVGVGLIATYLGMQTNRQVAEYNSQMGWPTQAVPAWGYGLPFFANGIYGALGGGTGSGSFGCGSGMYGGGYPNGMMGMMGPNGMFNPMMNGMQYGMSPFGNPYMNPYMMGPQIGGGAFLPGMGPWGMNSPFGMNPMLMGGAGMGMMVNMGMMNPYMQVGGYMNPYMMMNGGGMMNGGVMMAGNMMMSPMMANGMMMSPMMMNGGVMMNSMMNGGVMMNMMMNGMMNGGVMSPMMMNGGMYNPYAMVNGGIMMNGGMMMGGGLMMAGGMMSMGQMMNNQWQSQFYQQMYQMQMQQQQLQMQMVQRQQAEYMQRQQVVAGLQTELQGLLYRIQVVSSGGGMMGGGIGLGGYGGIGGGMGLGGYGNGYVTGNGGTISGGTLGLGSGGFGNSFGGSGYLYNNQYVPLNNGLYNNNINRVGTGVAPGTR